MEEDSSVSLVSRSPFSSFLLTQRARKEEEGGGRPFLYRRD